MAGSRRKKQIGVVKAGPTLGLPAFKVFEVRGDAPKFNKPAPELAGFPFSGNIRWYRDRRTGPTDRRKKDLGRAARKKKKKKLQSDKERK